MGFFCLIDETGGVDAFAVLPDGKVQMRARCRLQKRACTDGADGISRGDAHTGRNGWHGGKVGVAGLIAFRVRDDDGGA